jgi:hypothetical protein
VHDINTRHVDQRSRESPVRLRDLVAPVAAPVDRSNHHVVVPPNGADHVGRLFGGFFRVSSKKVQAGLVGTRRPDARYAAVRRAESEDEDPSGLRDRLSKETYRQTERERERKRARSYGREAAPL